jgi:hypothetical protein
MGAAFFVAFILGPNLKAAGPAAGGFMSVVLRRGGFGNFFVILGALTLLTGAYVYYGLGYTSGPFDTPQGTLLTLGAGVAILNYGHSLATLVPNETKMKKLVNELPPNQPPTPEFGAKFGELAAYQGKHAAVSGAALLLAVILMAIGRAF